MLSTPSKNAIESVAVAAYERKPDLLGSLCERHTPSIRDALITQIQQPTYIGTRA